MVREISRADLPKQNNEAFKLGSRVMVMNEGKLLQFDTPAEIVKNPADSFVRSLIEAARTQEQFWENVR